MDDILEALGPLGEPIPTDSGHEVRNGVELNLNDLERQVLGAIEANTYRGSERILRFFTASARIVTHSCSS